MAKKKEKMKENHSLSLALINLYLFLCRHLLINSICLFSRASSFAVKIAYFSARQRLHTFPPVLVRCCVANYFPRNRRIYTRIFARPNEFRKFCCIFFGIGIEGMVMVIESCFKFSFAQSDIVLGLIFGLYSCLIDDCFVSAVAIQWA